MQKWERGPQKQQKQGQGQNLIIKGTSDLLQSVYLNLWTRVEHFANFREMQKMALQKNFREKWVQNFAKVIMG